MRTGLSTGLALLLLTAPLRAQELPVLYGDPSVRQVDPSAGGPIAIEVMAGRQMTIAFTDDEYIEDVAIGDSLAWVVAASGNGRHLFVKTGGSSRATNMTVVTSVRSYSFELRPDPLGMSVGVSTIRVAPAAKAPAIEAATTSAPLVAPSGYRLKGAKSLQPSEIRDDGIHTYLNWPDSVSMPAVFGIDETGGEVLVDGFMRKGRYVIDRVYDRLVFRIDRLKAEAQRRLPVAL